MGEEKRHADFFTPLFTATTQVPLCRCDNRWASPRLFWIHLSRVLCWIPTPLLVPTSQLRPSVSESLSFHWSTRSGLCCRSTTLRKPLWCCLSGPSLLLAPSLLERALSAQCVCSLPSHQLGSLPSWSHLAAQWLNPMVASQPSTSLDLSKMLGMPDAIILLCLSRSSSCLFLYLFWGCCCLPFCVFLMLAFLLCLWSALWKILSTLIASAIICLLIIPSHDFPIFSSSLLLLKPTYPTVSECLQVDVL